MVGDLPSLTASAATTPCGCGTDTTQPQWLAAGEVSTCRLFDADG
jgi:hypothetical protein